MGVSMYYGILRAKVEYDEFDDEALLAFFFPFVEASSDDDDDGQTNAPKCGPAFCA